MSVLRRNNYRHNDGGGAYNSVRVLCRYVVFSFNYCTLQHGDVLYNDNISSAQCRTVRYRVCITYIIRFTALFDRRRQFILTTVRRYRRNKTVVDARRTVYTRAD